jgi:GNAT superfamily N-acetyltransferase
MSRDEIREIADIVGDDKAYTHFVKRINKEFDLSDEERNSKVYVIFEENKKGERVGFVVIGHSPAKMKVWGQTFRDEGWVDNDFQMDADPFELMYMYVQPKQRGKGYSNRLFKKVIDFTKEESIKEIYAYVSDRSPAALNFYKKKKANVIQDFSDEGFSTAFLSWKL